MKFLAYLEYFPGNIAHFSGLKFFCSTDGLVDCGDSNCCEHPACRESIMCVYFADPVDVLLRSVSILRMMILRLTMVMMVGSRHLRPVPGSSLRSGS